MTNSSLLEVSELSRHHAIPEIQSAVLVQELQGGAVLQYFLTSGRRNFPYQSLQVFLFPFLFLLFSNTHNEIHSFFQYKPVYFSGNQEATANLYQ